MSSPENAASPAGEPEAQQIAENIDEPQADPPAAADDQTGGDQDADDGGQTANAASVAAASAAAVAVAARLMAAHGEQAYPVSSGAEHAQAQTGDGTNNKRPREEDETGDGLEGPDKKRASSGMLAGGLNNGNPGDTNAAGEAGSNDPPGDLAGAEMVTETFDVPAVMVGKLIGRGGETIKQLQVSTDTRIQVDHSGEGPTKRVTVSGYTPEHVERAKNAIMALEHEEENQKIVECPPNLVGRVIGRGGETIRALQSASQAHVTVNQDFPPDVPRQVLISGNSEAVERAVLMVNELIHGEPGSAQAVIQRVCQAHGIGKSEVMTAPKMIIGRIIGRGGETIKQIQKVSGATVQIDQTGDPCKLTLAGQPGALEQAKSFITEIMNGGDPFNPAGPPGGYGAGGYGGMPPGGAPYGGYGGYGGGYGAYPGYGGYPGGPAMYGGYGGYPGGGGDPYAAAAYGGGAGGQYGAVGSGYPGAGGGEMQGGAGGAAAGPTPSPAAGGSGWQEFHDDQGRAYYYNATTGVTQWDKPADF